MSKKQRAKRHEPRQTYDKNMSLKEILPKTDNQELVFDYYEHGDNLLLHGCPGTGKSFLSLYLALRDVLSYDEYHSVIIIRSAQPSKNIGHLPGNHEEKLSNYETPYINICNELFGRGDAYQILKQKGMIEFESTSFLRGNTFDNCIIVVDESQNMTYMELKTILTRVGISCKIMVCGDVLQDDLTSARYNEASGFGPIMDILRAMGSVQEVEFGVDDIVRSGFVRDFIIAELGFNERGSLRIAS